ncbi:MAG: hypothetical protein ACO1RX_11805 [Candidatus Sericytochromatia bacterium]
MSLTPITAASLQASTQEALRRLAPTAEQLTVADVKGPGKLDADANGEISDGEFTGAAISDATDQAVLREAYATHGSEPTSPLVQFGTPTAEVPAGDPPAEAAVTEPAPVAGETPAEAPPAPAFTPLTDAAGLAEPRAVLKDAALETRLGELDTSVTQGLEVLNAQKTELEARWNALDEADTAGRAELGPQLEQTVNAIRQLEALQPLLRDRSNPQAVQALQNFLLDNDNGTSAEPSFDSRLSYPRGNETVNGADNLYGARTDAALRDFVGRTVQETRVPGPHARVQPPGAEVPAAADTPPVAEQAAVADAPPTEEQPAADGVPPAAETAVTAEAPPAEPTSADQPVSVDQPVIHWPTTGGLSFGTNGWMSLTNPNPLSSQLAFSPWTPSEAVSTLPLGYDASVWTPSFYQRPNPTLDLSLTGFSTFDPARFGPQPE